MNCHTWFFKPVNIHYEQAKQVAIEYLTNQLEEWTVENILYTADRYGEVNPYNWTEDVVLEQRAYYTRWLNRIKSGLPIWKGAVWYFLRMQESEVSMYYKGKYYIGTDYLDYFRVGWDLADTKLTSLQETLEFCKKYKNVVWFADNWLDKVTEFWQLYPDGLIKFG
jgi:hypothetical protein